MNFPSRSPICRLVITAPLLFLCLVPPVNGQTIRQWQGRIGNFRWNQGVNNGFWTGAVPDSSFEIARINNGGTNLQISTATPNVTVGGLQLLRSGSSVSVWGGRRLTLAGTASSEVAAGATLNVGIAPAFTGAVTTGTISGSSAPGTLQNHGLLQGVGTISAGFTNSSTGQIVANRSGRTVLLSGGGDMRSNEGSIVATSGGIVEISTSIQNTVGSNITAETGSRVAYNGATIQSGHLNGSGSGIHQVTGGTNFFTDTTVNQAFDVTAGTVEFQGANQVTADFIVGANGTVNIGTGTHTFGNLDNSAGGTFNHTGGTVIADSGAFDPGTGAEHFISGSSASDHPVLTLQNGATWDADAIRVGNASDGTLNVQSGASVDSSENVYVGHGSDTTGHLNVGGTATDGTMSSLTVTRGLQVGENSFGRMTLSDGGSVTANEVFVGSRTTANSNGIVTQTGGSLQATDVNVSWRREGQYNISGGTITTTEDFRVGNHATSNGSVMQTGGSVTVGDELQVGVSGTGRYTLTSGNIDVANATRIGADGTLNIDGGTFSTGSFDNSLGGDFNLTGGTFSVDGSFTPGSFSHTGGTFEVDTIAGDYSFSGGFWMLSP